MSSVARTAAALFAIGVAIASPSAHAEKVGGKVKSFTNKQLSSPSSPSAGSSRGAPSGGSATGTQSGLSSHDQGFHGSSGGRGFFSTFLSGLFGGSSSASDQSGPPQAPIPWDEAPTFRWPRMPLVQADLSLAFTYWAWMPQQFPLVRVGAQSYVVPSVEARVALGPVRVERFVYEAMGLAGPESGAASVASTAAGIVQGASSLLGVVGVSLGPAVPIVRYEARTFQSVSTPSAPVRIVPQDSSAASDETAFPLSSRTLAASSRFESAVFGIELSVLSRPSLVRKTRGIALASLYLGVAHTAFAKPYVLTIGGASLNDFLFDGRFSGWGGTFGIATARAPWRPFFEASMQYGAGDIQLQRDLKLSSAVPPDYAIHYVQGAAKAGYLFPLVESTPGLLVGFSGQLQGIHFFAFPKDEGDSQGLAGDLILGASTFLTGTF